MSARESDPNDAPRSDPLIGTRIAGRYRIDRIHARGGMSIVYSATYEAQQREVAIKVLDESSANDPEAIERFEHEARTASSLSHGHVVGVSDFGRLPDGRPYLVMPMIMGQDLATVISEQGPMPAARVATLLAGVASALDTMHAQGLVHRDIKSENIMYVRADSGVESALVLDFGIAAAPSAIQDGELVDTSGTPDFMAPEALTGAPSDHRADVYSLATVAFELLTGRLPYDGNDLGDLLRRRARNKPRTLSAATGLRFHRALEAVFERGLARDPDNRPSSAGELIRELAAAAAQARAPISAPPKAPKRKAVTLKALALHALSGPSSAAPRLARLRTLVGLPFTRPPSGDAKKASVKRPLPAPVHTPQSGVHRRPAPNAPPPEASPPEPSSPEASIVIDPSLWVSPPAQPSPPPRPEPPIDSLSPIAAEPDIDDPPFVPRSKAPLRIALAAAAAVAVLGIRLWQGSGDASSTASMAHPAAPKPPPVSEATPPAPAAPTAPTAPPVEPAAPPVITQPEVAPAQPPARPRSVAQKERARPARAARPVAVVPEPKAPVLRVTPSAQDLTQQAVDAMLRGAFGDALGKLDAAIAASPRYAPAFRSKGLVLERMGKKQEAAKAFRQYLRLEPNARDAAKIEARLAGLQ